MREGRVRCAVATVRCRASLIETMRSPAARKAEVTRSGIIALLDGAAAPGGGDQPGRAPAIAPSDHPRKNTPRPWTRPRPARGTFLIAAQASGVAAWWRCYEESHWRRRQRPRIITAPEARTR